MFIASLDYLELLYYYMTPEDFEETIVVSHAHTHIQTFQDVPGLKV